MSMTFRHALGMAVAVAVTMCASTVSASESDPGVAVPAPVGDVPITVSIDKVTVRVRDLDVAIQYTLKNSDKKAASTNLTIYGPLFGWQGVDSSCPDKAFLELQVATDKAPIKAQRHVAAFFRGELVNAELARLHIDPLWTARNPEVLLDAATAPNSKLRLAAQAGLLNDLGQGMAPNWYTLVSHSWKTVVSAQNRGYLTLSYHLRPAYEAYDFSDPRLSSVLHEHCASVEQLQEQIKASGRSAPESVVALKYSIPIGLGNARLPPSTNIEFHQDKTWAGLRPLLSFSCKVNGKAAIGRPDFSDDISWGTGPALSVLVLLPQE